ncbi:MAG: DUF4294 domain-containing protein [Paludibacteraceae bacterium]|jgi:hypothetical protein|nr:DUF4294 domain-containing protein [Paludibacteraceae bacterium]NLK91802.1 DUF4294 domain-containing protein [Bacteroidales bacterium]MBP6436246.1 DUF4294 domain-containing protein [Paludibacteraceae bacterium]MBP7219499.1 DUF4294 domain-containing protein [Paludibacteraceae bacterium]MBP8627686.1 DUF4294 domain-containing protein [Paludibacteraceae bacterium]
MKNKLFLLGNIIVLLSLSLPTLATSYIQTAQGYILPGIVVGNDTIPIVVLNEHIVYPKYVKKRDQQKYNKLVRDIKKVYPFAKVVGKEVERVNPLLEKLPQKERKKYMREYEKALFKQYEPDLKKLTLTQGKLLIKLIDRECEQSSFDLIREYRGGLTAFFWQGFARILGANLKEDFNDAKSEDAMINRIIILIENGQL